MGTGSEPLSVQIFPSQGASVTARTNSKHINIHLEENNLRKQSLKDKQTNDSNSSLSLTSAQLAPTADVQKSADLSLKLPDSDYSQPSEELESVFDLKLAYQSFKTKFGKCGSPVYASTERKFSKFL